MVFGFRLSIYVSGLALLAVSGLVALRRGLQPTAEVVAWLALCQLTTRFVVDILKPVFGRLRPHEAMTAGLLDGRFFSAVGNSFPSGHAAHFWGFYFALALLFPRWWIPLLVLPLLISAARVIATDHYVSDVIGSAAIAALVTSAYYGRLVRPHRLGPLAASSRRRQ